MGHVMEWWPLFAAVVGAGVLMLRYLIGHSNKHRQTDERLDRGDVALAKNTEEHERIFRRLGMLVTGIKELMVHAELRKPGQGINGDDDD